MNGRTWIGVGIPLVGLALLVARAELRLREGETWQIAIRGYDPRDLVHGHYLRYRYGFRWSEIPSTCGTHGRLDAECCLCLTRTSIDPEVRQVTCAEARTCVGSIRSSAVLPPLRYLIPEAKAVALERAVRRRKASLRINTARDGQVAVHQLLLDGLPWEEALREQ